MLKHKTNENISVVYTWTCKKYKLYMLISVNVVQEINKEIKIAEKCLLYILICPDNLQIYSLKAQYYCSLKHQTMLAQ